MNRIRVPWVFFARVEKQGITSRQLLRQAHLPQTLLQQERVTVTIGQLFALWKAVEELSRDPAIGLKIGSDARIEHYDPISLAALSSRTFRNALEKMARYKSLCCSEEMRLTEEQGKCAITLTWLAAAEPEPPLLLEAAFAAIQELGRHGSGLMLHPQRIELKREARHRTLYETHFNCPVYFGAERNAVVYNDEALSQPFVTSNPDLLMMLAPQLEATLAEQLSERNLPGQVQRIQRQRLVGQRLNIQEVAIELSMSPRTLQRRLADDGTSFQQLLDDVRYGMAKQYLVDPTLNLNEISYLLGYEEANSFHRAFHQWEGVSPGQWRLSQGRALASHSEELATV